MSMTESKKTLTEMAYDKLAEYANIGTVEEFRRLKEKATAKEVKPRQCWKCENEECVPGCELTFDRCPNCNEVLDNDCGEQYKFCPDCGQRLLWT